jgi:CRP/FNR family transcriptional regulator, cyclic AMP receptor protein
MAQAFHSPFIVYRDGTGHEQLVALEEKRERVTVGRGEATDLWLEWDAQASRLHAAFERLGSQWTVVDDGLSRNGTYVNGMRVQGRRRLADGDVVRCGSTELEFHTPAGEVTGMTVKPGAGPILPSAPTLATQLPKVDTKAVEILSKTSPFTRLERAEVERLAEVAVPRRYGPGEALFREGDPGDTCYVLSSGSVRVTRTHSDGRTVVLAHLRPPALLGEMAMFGSAPRSATGEAVEDTTALAIVAGDMRRLLMSRPVLAMAMLDDMAERVRRADDSVSQRSFRNVPGRIAEVLLSQIGDNGDGAVVELTHAALADMAGTSRETVSRFLAQLEKAGVLTCGRRQVTVVKSQALRNYIY